MSYIFSNAGAFNQPLEKWNVSNVTKMFLMFHEAKSFDQSLNKWDISNVTNMIGMFSGAHAFNHYPASWIVPPNKSYNMFDGTKVEKLAKEKPLKTR